ncbi:ACP S-malonyltransferase [Saccharothrix syringae]|uniref:[acyl-carrier-protein] S-malonyltransferase n=1 Tax=Saccharothrix syringae TaxID=103733 RepID=A0A5Q0H3E6_SACSY|nr:acyltransferase domain-containing protein [Saccharothrix syringae]QFZ20731.1 acyltransferase domain-containing protein [Saccharothrix syringae]
MSARTRAADRPGATDLPDAEVLLVDAPDHGSLRPALTGPAELLAGAGRARLADLAGSLAAELSGHPVRAAVVAATAAEARARLRRLAELVDAGETDAFRPEEGLFLGRRATPPRIALLFPARGPRGGSAGAVGRFPAAADVLRAAGGRDGQARVVATSLATARALESLGVRAEVAVGHSLGEFTAFAWAGAVDDERVLALAAARDRAMDDAGDGAGGMAVLLTGAERATALARGERDVVVAGFHSPHQVVLSGPADALDRVCAAALDDGVPAFRLNAPHAFHTPRVRAAADAMAEVLAGVAFAPVTREVVSTVTARPVGGAADVRGLLRDQVLAPVRFHQAAARAIAGADLVLEAGPGRALTDLVAEIDPAARALATETDGPSSVPLLTAVAAAFALGAPVDGAALFAGRVWSRVRTRLPRADDGLERVVESCCRPAVRPSAAG